MSVLKANNWSCVIVGRWNPAILSPKGIATHLFHMSPEIAFDVLVPLDAAGPPVVRIEELRILAGFNKLTIECENNNWESIQKARECCVNAIDALPLTPLSAAGYNFRYEVTDPDPDEPFFGVLSSSMDDKISDQGLDIIGREIHRSMQWNGGNLNLKIANEKPDSYDILLNFDKQTADIGDMKAWLTKPIEDVCEIVRIIMCNILEICDEEVLGCPIQQSK